MLTKIILTVNFFSKYVRCFNHSRTAYVLTGRRTETEANAKHKLTTFYVIEYFSVMRIRSK